MTSTLFPDHPADSQSLYDLKTAGLAAAPVFVGAGRFGRSVVEAAARAGMTPVAMTDNAPSNWGKSVCGVPVLPVAEAVERYGRSHPFVVTILNCRSSFVTLRDQLEALGVRAVIPFCLLAWKHPADFLPYYYLDTPERWLGQRTTVEAAWRLLGEEDSRAEFRRQSLWRSTGDFALMGTPGPGPAHFGTGLFRLGPRPLLVDCGAFDGDTIADWVEWTGGDHAGVIAFEPDPGNAAKLRDNMRAWSVEGVEIHQAGVGQQPGEARFDIGQSAGSAQSSQGATAIRIESLDDALAGRKPDMIKMDVEGAEFDAILGCLRTIRQHRCVLAVSVYHLPEDLWRIPLLIASITRDYVFALRRHGGDGFDTVFYAIPRELATFRPPSLT